MDNQMLACLMLLAVCLSSFLHSDCINALYFSICKQLITRQQQQQQQSQQEQSQYEYH